MAFTIYVYKFNNCNALLYSYFVSLRITLKYNCKKEQ